MIRDPSVAISLHDFFRYHVARREFGELVPTNHEPLTLGVEQLAALAPHRLTYQWELATCAGPRYRTVGWN